MLRRKLQKDCPPITPATSCGLNISSPAFVSTPDSPGHQAKSFNVAGPRVMSDFSCRHPAYLTKFFLIPAIRYEKWLDFLLFFG